jgi:FAD binding domain of DNA photolyase/DNA photolyase
VSASVNIVWLRDDFRLDDQPAIHAASKKPTLFVYVHDDAGGGARPLGGAAKLRLDTSVARRFRAFSLTRRRRRVSRLGASPDRLSDRREGLRQLWRTGYLPNRARLIVASFLVKHLLIDWRRGEEWFWDTLIDGDPANKPSQLTMGRRLGRRFRALLPHLQSRAAC